MATLSLVLNELSLIITKNNFRHERGEFLRRVREGLVKADVRLEGYDELERFHRNSRTRLESGSGHRRARGRRRHRRREEARIVFRGESEWDHETGDRPVC